MTDSTDFAASTSSSCPSCDGTGFVLRDVGGVSRAMRCRCLLAALDDRRLGDARIPRRYAECSLENFIRQGTVLQDRARRVAHDFLSDYPLNSATHGLLFLGRPGLGKTHLAVAILRGLILEKSVRALFYDYGELLRAIQSTWSRDSEVTELSILDPVRTVDVLLLDDLGSTRTSLWVQEILFHILNSRYNQDRMTILTSNHPDAAPEAGASAGRARDIAEASLEAQIGTRLRSRLHEMCRTIEMDGKDFRKEIKSADNQHRM